MSSASAYPRAEGRAGMTESAARHLADQKRVIDTSNAHKRVDAMVSATPNQPGEGRALDPCQAHGPPVRPAFCTIDMWEQLTGMSRRAAYEAIARGDLIARK